MGMFDSFYVNGEEYQTKELDCVLDSYTLGSKVPDHDGKSSYYLVIGHSTKIGIVIIDNTFVAHCPPEEAETTFNFFRTKSNELTRQLTHIITNELQPKIEFYGGVAFQVSRLLWEYEKWIKDQENPNDEEHKPFMQVFYRHCEDFNNGKTLYDILKTIKYRYGSESIWEEAL